MDSRKNLSRKEALAALQRTRRGDDDNIQGENNDKEDRNEEDKSIHLSESSNAEESDNDDWIIHDDEIKANRILKRKAIEMEMLPTPSELFTSNSTSKKINPTKHHKDSIIDDVLEEIDDFEMSFDSENENVNNENNMKIVPEITKKNSQLDFYWLDAFEHPGGTVDLFGKTSNSISAKLSIKNIQRTLYFLPRESNTLTFKDVEEEINELSLKYQWKDLSISCVKRRYAFEVPNIPIEADWIKVRMKFPSSFSKEIELRNDGENGGHGGRTFSHCFGIGTGPLELLLLKSKLKGPSWLKISSFTISKINPNHYTISNRKLISHPDTQLPKPLLSSMCISIKTSKKEIISISLLHNASLNLSSSQSFKDHSSLQPFTIFKGNDRTNSSSRIAVKDEESLLLKFISLIGDLDPDLLIGHHLVGPGSILFSIIERLKHCHIKEFSLLGRSFNKRNTTVVPSITLSNHQWIERTLTQGRLLVCSMISSKDILKLKSYSLTSLCRHFGIINSGPSSSSSLLLIEEISDGDLSDHDDHDDHDDIDDLCNGIRDIDSSSTTNNLEDMLKLIEKETFLTNSLSIALQILPLTLQLTTIAGNLWGRTLIGGRAERNEALLLHEFYSKKYILPDKNLFNKSTKKRKAAYEGGLVLEPKRGLYETIVILLDFNSLYPSIIQEYNICFSTISRGIDTKMMMMMVLPEHQHMILQDKDKEEEHMMLEPQLPPQPQGILPSVLKSLVQKRRLVKQKMKDTMNSSTLNSQLNIEQQALKLTANSMYGCLGFTNSRFYAPEIASLITKKGRDILSSTVDIAQSLDLDVIYGDTDSVMINTASSLREDALRMGNSLKKAVNAKFNLLEIEMESMFSKLLLLRKKKYAALIMSDGAGDGSEDRIECKGLDLVRRDWSPISSIISKKVLNSILRGPSKGNGSSNLGTEILTILSQLGENISKEPLSSFIISKNLTKSPSQYLDQRSQPHVMVALRYEGKDGLKLGSGDIVPYVICKRPSSPSSSKASNILLSDCAFHPDELNPPSKHEIDLVWYLGQQIHPCINRLCEFVIGCSSSKIAKALGLNDKKFSSPSGNGNGLNDGGCERYIDETQEALLKCSTGALLAGKIDERERWSGVDAGNLFCCSKNFSIKESLEEVGFLNCPLCKERPLNWMKQCSLLLKERIHSYYQYCMKCSNCSIKTRMPRMYESDLRCPNIKCTGLVSLEMSAESLYRTLLFFRYLFDTKTIKKQFFIRKEKMTLDEEAQSIIVEEMGDRFSKSCEPIRMLIDGLINQSSYPIVQLGLIFKKQHIPML